MVSDGIYQLLMSVTSRIIVPCVHLDTDSAKIKFVREAVKTTKRFNKVMPHSSCRFEPVAHGLAVVAGAASRRRHHGSDKLDCRQNTSRGTIVLYA